VNTGRRLRLGILTLVAGGAFFGLLAFVLQGVLRNNRVSYFLLCEENVKGMVIGSKVNFQGVPFGAVTDMRFQDGKTLVEMSVDPTRAELQDITRARLDRLLVTGQVTVELEGYGPEGKRLRPGQFVRVKQDPINQLTKTLPELVPQMARILEKFETALDRGNELLADENRAAFVDILKHGHVVAQQLPDVLAHTDALMVRGEAAAATFERAAARLDADLLPAGAETLADLRLCLADLRALRTVCTEALRDAQALVGGLRSPAQAALAALRSSLEELRSFARQLRLAPESLLFGVTRPAAPMGGGR
jgi:ABC-type transporter Mla subunit MlaD